MGTRTVGYWAVPLDDLSKEDRAMVLWGLVWRAACFVIGWLIFDGLLAFAVALANDIVSHSIIVGHFVIVTSRYHPTKLERIIKIIIEIPCGIAAIYYYLKMVLSANFGELGITIIDSRVKPLNERDIIEKYCREHPSSTFSDDILR